MFTKYYHTLIHLKPIQIRYQLWYRIRRSWRKMSGFKYPLSTKRDGYPLVLKPFIPKNNSFDNFRFTFLNQPNAFAENAIDWNFNKNGKLWTYNLNYFDFLLQPGIKVEEGQTLIEDFILKLKNNSTALEPYPIALRGINWIKFIAQCSSSNSQILKFSNSLFAQYQILLDNIEYHLLGNHLLEDGFSLLFGAFYFRDEKFYRKAVEIIKPELDEQILEDGAHFELSPMYHQIILDRLLDCINLVQNNQRFANQESILIFLKEKAVRMLQWLNGMTFSNGQIPLLNDSTTGIAATTDQLNQYAIRLEILTQSAINVIRNNSCNLNESGYRRFNSTFYECIFDIGHIGPSYQTGHAHADTFNFVLNVNNLPFIVDTGISTYEDNDTRLNERGTAAHNTSTIQDKNSSQIWSSFRVAKRAKVKIITREPTEIVAIHNGYQSIGLTHQRSFQFEKKSILIIDSLLGKSSAEGTVHLHFHPDVHISQAKSELIVDNKYCIKFNNYLDLKIIDYQYPLGYNKYISAKKCLATFHSTMSFKIILYED
ncbi:MAG: heparinase II/III family protein [Prolixibacteraceae bacterium]|nr:heparinase II/III family protein [Prolixibacteraceae bacterium]